jgi:predicted membrane protein
VLFLQTQLGFGLVVLLPIFLLLIYQGIVLFMHIYELKREKLLIEQKELQEKAKQELEAEKERIRQELLKELQEKNKDK